MNSIKYKLDNNSPNLILYKRRKKNISKEIEKLKSDRNILLFTITTLIKILSNKFLKI